MYIKNIISCWERITEVEMMIGLMMLTLKYVPVKGKVNCWLRDAALRTISSKCSSKISRGVSDKGNVNSKKYKDSHESRSWRTSRVTRSSKSSKYREIKEKIKIAELVAEAELLQKKQMIQNEAEKLKIKERLAKASTQQHRAWKW